MRLLLMDDNPSAAPVLWEATRVQSRFQLPLLLDKSIEKSRREDRGGEKFEYELEKTQSILGGEGEINQPPLCAHPHELSLRQKRTTEADNRCPVLAGKLLLCPAHGAVKITARDVARN